MASPPNHDYLLSLGASEAFDYYAADWAQQVRAVVPGGVDLLFDGAGGQTRDRALDAVRDGGRAISIVLQGTPLQLARGITGESFAAHGGRPRLEQLAALVDAGLGAFYTEDAELRHRWQLAPCGRLVQARPSPGKDSGGPRQICA